MALLPPPALTVLTAITCNCNRVRSIANSYLVVTIPGNSDFFVASASVDGVDAVAANCNRVRSVPGAREKAKKTAFPLMVQTFEQLIQ